jgi:hypothetical protein
LFRFRLSHLNGRNDSINNLGRLDAAADGTRTAAEQLLRSET